MEGDTKQNENSEEHCKFRPNDLYSESRRTFCNLSKPGLPCNLSKTSAMLKTKTKTHKKQNPPSPHAPQQFKCLLLLYKEVLKQNRNSGLMAKSPKSIYIHLNLSESSQKLFMSLSYTYFFLRKPTVHSAQANPYFHFCLPYMVYLTAVRFKTDSGPFLL